MVLFTPLPCLFHHPTVLRCYHHQGDGILRVVPLLSHKVSCLRKFDTAVSVRLSHGAFHPSLAGFPNACWGLPNHFRGSRTLGRTRPGLAPPVVCSPLLTESLCCFSLPPATLDVSVHWAPFLPERRDSRRVSFGHLRGQSVICTSTAALSRSFSFRFDILLHPLYAPYLLDLLFHSLL